MNDDKRLAKRVSKVVKPDKVIGPGVETVLDENELAKKFELWRAGLITDDEFRRYLGSKHPTIEEVQQWVDDQ